MADNEGYLYAYGWNDYYQKLLGLWTRKGEGLIARHKAWAWALLIFLCVWLPQISCLPLLDGNLNLIIEDLSTNIAIVIGSILVVMAEDWAAISTKLEHETMWGIARITRFISILSFLLTITLCAEYIISEVWEILKNEEQRNLDPRLSVGLPLISYYPFDTTKLVIFVPLWLVQCLSAIVSSMSYAAADCIVSMMVLHLCGQLRIIRRSLKNLVDEVTMKEPQQYWKRLSAIIKRHERVNRMGLIVKESFSSILLVQIVACSVTFCFQGYALIATSMDDSRHSRDRILKTIFSLIYGVYTMTHLFIYCYVGDRLLVESTKICDDFYETSWYDLAPKEARAFLFVGHRSKIPLELRAGKFCVFNMQLFNAILKNSMGYLSILMAMKDRI